MKSELTYLQEFSLPWLQLSSLQTKEPQELGGQSIAFAAHVALIVYAPLSCWENWASLQVLNEPVEVQSAYVIELIEQVGECN